MTNDDWEIREENGKQVWRRKSDPIRPAELGRPILESLGPCPILEAMNAKELSDYLVDIEFIMINAPLNEAEQEELESRRRNIEKILGKSQDVPTDDDDYFYKYFN